MAHLDVKDGTQLEVHAIGQHTTHLYEIAVRPDGDVYLGGIFAEEIDLGGIHLKSGLDEFNAFVARVRP